MKLLNEKHVAVAPGAAFGMDGFIGSLTLRIGTRFSEAWERSAIW